MTEETIYTELFKAGLKLVGDNLTKVISKINDRRLLEKKKKAEEKEKKKDFPRTIQLSKSEAINGKINLNVERASENVQRHIQEIVKWAHIINFSDLEKKKSLKSVYVQLDTYVIPAKRHISDSEKDKTIPLERAILSNNEHCVILGQPGAGKTTSLKKICDIVIREEKKSDFTFPILLRLRDLGEISSKNPIIDHVLRIIPLEFIFNETNDSNFSVGIEDAKEEVIFSFLNFAKPIFILDGFDELKDVQAKRIVLNELRNLALKLTEAKFVLSCRTGEFNYELEQSNTYEIAPLNSYQIELFVNKWLNDKIKADDFLTKVKNSPFADTSIKPLSLAHLCAIYDRIGNIPDQPKTVYRKVVNLLIEEWDEQRSIIRSSEFSSFSADQKFEFLTHLSFYLTSTFQASTFSISQFKSSYNSICEYHNLPIQKATDVVRELESHTGLFIESGYEKFEFVHKSIQEYLAAEYIVKLPSLNTIKKDFETLGSELAISVSISSDSSLYYIELILNYFLRTHLSNSFYSTFISRIISERPSFRQNELVSVATLVLVSNWINPENRKFTLAYNPVLDEQMIPIFKNLAESLNLKEQRVKINKYYKYNSGIDNNRFVELIRIKEPENHKRLPSKIYLPIEFYEEFNM